MRLGFGSIVRIAVVLVIVGSRGHDCGNTGTTDVEGLRIYTAEEDLIACQSLTIRAS